MRQKGVWGFGVVAVGEQVVLPAPEELSASLPALLLFGLPLAQQGVSLSTVMLGRASITF